MENALFYAGIYGGIFIGYMIVFGLAFALYHGCQEKNARMLDKRVNSRLLGFKNQHERSQRMLEQIENVHGLSDEEIVDQAGDWALLSIWTPARAIHFCRFVKNQLYQVSKSFLIAGIVCGVIYVSASYAIWTFADVPRWLGVSAFLASLAFVPFLFRDPMRPIRTHIDEKEWAEISRFRLYDTFRNIVRIEKQKYLIERGRFRGR